jgi:hypothetical protein
LRASRSLILRIFHVIARSLCDEAIHRAAYAALDCVVASLLAMTMWRRHAPFATQCVA